MRLQFDIRGMCCSGCEKRIKHRLQKLGIRSQMVDRKLGIAIVDCDERRIKPLIVHKVIEDEGYGIKSCKQLLLE